MYYIDQGNLVLNLAKIDRSVQIFSDFEFFKNFLYILLLRQILIYQAKILCVNALILSDVWYYILCESVETFKFYTDLIFFLLWYQLF